MEKENSFNNNIEGRVTAIYVVVLIQLVCIVFFGVSINSKNDDGLYSLRYSAQELKDGMIGSACINAGHKWMYGNCQYKDK